MDMLLKLFIMRGDRNYKLFVYGILYMWILLWGVDFAFNGCTVHPVYNVFTLGL